MTKYAHKFAEMEIGDEIKVLNRDGDSARISARQWGLRNGVKFATRRDGRWRRIWRIE